MTTVDLITGFLGSGKTTFMKKYVRRLMDNGHNVCILENDFGAVNVDTMLLQELSAEGCGIEMVSGACDKHCHRRRFKTKLIAMAMSGYDHVVIEPSGVFDVDEFYDTLSESPLDRMYKIGSVIAIVDPTNKEVSEKGDYLLASQCAVAGKIVFSHINDQNGNEVPEALSHIKVSLEKIRSDRDPFSYYIAKPWNDLTEDDYSEIEHSGYKEASFVKIQDEQSSFGSVYFLNIDPSVGKLRSISEKILSDTECGHVFRVKGFTIEDGSWYEINATHKSCEIKPIVDGQSVIIVIGEDLNKNKISEYFAKENL